MLLFVVEGCADLGSSKEGEVEKVCRGVIADCGYGEDGFSLFVKRQRIGWTICAPSWFVVGAWPVLGVFGAMAT